MKTIYKYPLEITDEQYVTVPDGAQFLSAQMQGSQLCIWALVDTDNFDCRPRVKIFGTGHHVEVDDGWKFVGTVQDRIFVWHIFIENL